MKRMRIAGLCLVAMFAITALSAMAASSAYAGEYGVCVKAQKVEKKYVGLYTDKNCQTAASEKEVEEGKKNKYEWVSAAGEKSTTTTKTAVLSSAAGKITCKKSKGTAEITGAKSDLETVEFEECTLSVTGGKCTSVQEGEKEGNITTFQLETKLIDHGEKGPSGGEPAEGEAWTEFNGEAGNGGLQAEFVCAPGVIFRTSGTLSGVTTPVNLMESKDTTSFGEGKGEQDLVTEFSENGGISFENTGPNVETAVGTAKGVVAGSKEKGKTEVRTPKAALCAALNAGIHGLETVQKKLANGNANEKAAAIVLAAAIKEDIARYEKMGCGVYVP